MRAFVPMLRRAGFLLVAIAMAIHAGPARAAGRHHHHRRHQRTGKIVVHSLTVGAAILVDGRWVGTVPLEKPLAGLKAGKHKLRVTRLGFMAYDATVVVHAGRTTSVEADLLPFAGILDLTSNVLGATVKLGSKTLGKTPIRDREIALGKHDLVVSKDGYDPWRKKLLVIAGKRYELSASLKPTSAAALPLVALTTPPAAKPKPKAQPKLEPPPPMPAPPVAIAPPPPSKPIADNGPMWHRWWFWAAVGTVVAVAGVGAAASASQGPGTPLCISTPVDGTIGTCRSH